MLRESQPSQTPLLREMAAHLHVNLSADCSTTL